MDRTETYIKMCDCPEIQDGHKWEYGDWLIAEHGFFQIGTASFDYDITNPKIPPIRSELPVATIQAKDACGSIFSGDLIWLPHQGQLQRILWDNDEQQSQPAVMLFIIVDGFPDKEGIDFRKTGNMYYRQFASMEQLWLAFVMKEKYEKTWDGDKWVK